MAILWLIIGFVLGLVAAWYYLNARFENELAEREAELVRRCRKAEEALEAERDAHNSTRKRLSELEARRSPARQLGVAPRADLKTGGEDAKPPRPASASPGAAPAGGAADDLTKIKGIGKVLAGKLNGLGFTKFAQIAAFTQADIERVGAQLNFPGRIEREKWVEQARALMRGNAGA